MATHIVSEFKFLLFKLQVEYAVQMKCNSCKETIVKELSSIPGLKIADINVKEQRVVLQLGEESPSAFEIQSIIEDKLGINAIIRGTGDFITSVAELRGSQDYSNVFGVARFVQNESRQCLLDAVIDGLEGDCQYQLGVHKYGDLSEPNYSSIGKQIFLFAKDARVSNSPKLTIKSRVDNCDLSSFVGRAFAITTGSNIVGAGIVARASKVLDNSKKICACSGKTLWEEREDNKA